MSTDNFYSPQDAMQMLGLPYGQVIRAIRSGKLSATKVGWGWVISAEALEAYKKTREDKDDSNQVSA